MNCKIRKNKIKRSKQDLIFDIVIYTIAALITLLSLYPMYFVLIASFSDPNAVARGLVDFFPVGFSLKGYGALIGYKELWIGYRNTIFYAALGTLFCLMVNIPAGYALSWKELYGRKVIMVYFIITMFFGGGLIPTFLNIKNFGLYDTIWVLVLPFSVSAYYIIVSRTFFNTSIPLELWDSAQIDGATTIQYFFKVALPLSKAIIAVIALWTAVGKWNSYFDALVYIRKPELQPLQMVLRSILVNNQAVSSMLTGEAASAARELSELIKYAVIIVSSAPLICMYPFVQKHFNQGVMLGSLKG